MNKKAAIFLPFLCFVIPFLISSCSSKFYAPTTAITPLLREKGETQFSGHFGAGDEIDKSLQLQAAWAFDSNLAIAANIYAAEGGNKLGNSNYGNGSQLELAAGYFCPITSKLSYELYGGLAMGKASNHFLRTYSSDSLGTTSFPYQIDNNCFKPFVQGNIGYRSTYFDAILHLRAGYLSIGQLDENFPIVDPSYKTQANDDIDLIKKHPNSFLIEPGFTLRAGYEPIKLQLHLGWSINSNGSHYPQEGGIVSLGVVGMLNSTTKKNKTPHLNF